MKDNYITIGELQEFVTCSIWVGTDRATRKECTVSINGFRTKYGWKNLHAKVKREDLLEYINGKITLLGLLQLREPDSLVIQNVCSVSGSMEEEKPSEWPKFLEGMFDWKFDRLRCVDREEIDEFLEITTKEF